MNNTKSSVRQVLQFLRSVIRKSKYKFSALMILRSFTAAIPMILPFYYAQIVDTIAASGGPSEALVQTLLGVVWLILLWISIERVVRRVIEWLVVSMETLRMKNLYDRCFSYLQRHSYSFFANNFGGALVKKVNKLIRAYETVVDVLVFDLVMIAVTIIATLRVVRGQHQLLGRLFTVWLLLFGVAQYVMRKKIMPYDIASQESDSKVTAYLADTITNHYTITTFASRRRELAGFATTTEGRRSLTHKSWASRNVIFAINSGIMITFEVILRYSLITLWGRGLISVGMIVVLQIYVLILFEKIFMIGNLFKRTFQAIAEGAEMVDILTQKHEIQDHTQDSLQVSGGAIAIREVSFGYEKSNGLFDQLNLSIAAGEKVALVGPSGSGKSTLIKLLMRFVDIQKGKIFIDQQDIAQVTQESLRSSMSVVPQDPMLFHRSLRDNIAYGRPDATDEEVHRAATMARCHDFIQKLEHGYDTLVGERGIKLSGGERQRVAIARAILENKKVLIMDEATSSLDSESEKLIQDAVHELIKDKTAIVIAHRLSTIREMDRIIVMEYGKVVEQGTHEQLLSRKDGLYNKLWSLQSE